MKRLLPWLAVAISSALLSGATCFGPAEPIVQPELQTARPVIGPSDVLTVRVFGEPDLSGDYRVESTGAVTLPLVGDVEIDGLTPDQARERIEAAYNAKYLRDANVTVLIKEANSRKVVVIGQVGKSGSYPYEERMTVIDAIARAGGTSQLADVNRTIITRTVDGKKVTLEARVGDIRRGKAPDVEVLPGDVVFVPELLF